MWTHQPNVRFIPSECCRCCSRKVCDWASSRWSSSDAVRLCLCGPPVQVMKATPVRLKETTRRSALPACPLCSNNTPRSTCPPWESQSLSLTQALSLNVRGKTARLQPPPCPPRPPPHSLTPPPPPPLPLTLFFSHPQPCLSWSPTPLYWPLWLAWVPAKVKQPANILRGGLAISVAVGKRSFWKESRFLVRQITSWRSPLFSGLICTPWLNQCWALCSVRAMKLLLDSER